VYSNRIKKAGRNLVVRIRRSVYGSNEIPRLRSG
jgi:hypothetical protein